MVNLEQARLPRSYPRMTYGEKQAARKQTLTGWFDPDRPNILCIDVEAFIAAHYLWVEHYMKADPHNKGIYFREDMLGKYDMVRMAMSEPTVKTEPAKSVVHAPRRLGKTQTLIQEMVPLMCLNRPFTQVLVSEENATRTAEEIKKIRIQLERNKQIQADFGGPGELFPRSKMGGFSWRDDCLDFIHHPGSSILGHSIESAQRGRGPIFGIIDDPERDDNSYSKKWRREFFQKLFGVYLPMFHSGGKLLWIGTVIHGQSCLHQALSGLSQATDEEEAPDPRFNDWHKRRFKMIETDDKGQYYSRCPELVSVEAFEKKKETIGLTAVMAELQGTPINPGQVAFNFHPTRHGYMREEYEGKEYFLDLFTGERIPWDTWKDSLLVFGAGDLADGASTDSDPGSIVFVGVDKAGVMYVLDVLTKKIHADKLVEQAYIMAEKWDCLALGWEKTGMQTVVVRLARRHVEQLRKEGKAPPAVVPIENRTKSKINRILTMIPLFETKKIKFPYTRLFMDKHGQEHKSVRLPNSRYHSELQDQIQAFTDEGLAGHDDAIDALEMAVRMAGTKKPKEALFVNQDDLVLEKWNESGFQITKEALPVKHWSPNMWSEWTQDFELETPELLEDFD